MPQKCQTVEISSVTLNITISKCWKSRITGNRVPLLGRTDWFHYKLLRKSKHLCVEARHIVVNKQEISLAQRPAGMARHGSSPCGLVFSSFRRAAASLLLVGSRPRSAPTPELCPDLVKENELLGTGHSCGTRRASSFLVWVIAGWSTSVFPGPDSLFRAGCSPTCPASC